MTGLHGNLGLCKWVGTKQGGVCDTDVTETKEKSQKVGYR